MLPISGYRLYFNGTPSAPLPRWLGSTWRGCLGHSLRRLACRCDTPHQPDCVYAYLFETPVPEDAKRLRKYPSAPHPYILRPLPRDERQPQTLALEVLLLGNARRHSRVFLQALIEGASRGLGPTQAPFRIDNISELPVQRDIPPTRNGDRLDITLRSPHRIQYQGKLMNPDRFDIIGWLTNLMRRCNTLRYFHGDGQQPTDAQVAEMLAAIRQVTLTDKAIDWISTARHSSRQKQKIDQSGLTGRFALAPGDSADALMPLLTLGTLTHVGKSTVMGHGQFSLKSVHEAT